MFPLPIEAACPPMEPGPVQVEIVAAGTLSSDWKWVVNDGTTGPVQLPMLVGVLRHPKALLTVDAGFGALNRTKEEPGFPMNKGDFAVPEGATAVERLGRIPDKVLMTHLHYDHVGGLPDMPGAEVWVDQNEWAAYGPGKVGFPRRVYRDAVNWKIVDLSGQGPDRVLGRPALDVMGDGSIWYLSLPGHTPGAAGVFVRGTNGPVLFVGDTAWVDKHLGEAMRPGIVSKVVDANRIDHAASLEWARKMRVSCPDLVIVTGHEPKWMEAQP
jgi:glyoxylase-like metal-dependent hydrolase (beta-lactamase superfamily II)